MTRNPLRDLANNFYWARVRVGMSSAEVYEFKGWLLKNPDAGTTLMGDKKYPEFKVASQIHDWRYDTRNISKREADAEFSRNMATIIKAAPPRRRWQLRMARWQRNLGVRGLIARLVWWT